MALDVSLFVSPDNPWIVEHPQWVRRKADGTPTDPLDPQSERKDMLPLDFDADPDGIVKAIGLDECQLCTYCWNGKE